MWVEGKWKVFMSVTFELLSKTFRNVVPCHIFSLGKTRILRWFFSFLFVTKAPMCTLRKFSFFLSICALRKLAIWIRKSDRFVGFFFCKVFRGSRNLTCRIWFVSLCWIKAFFWMVKQITLCWFYVAPTHFYSQLL